MGLAPRREGKMERRVQEDSVRQGEWGGGTRDKKWPLVAPAVGGECWAKASRVQVCFLKPRACLWLPRLHLRCLTEVCAVTERTSKGDKLVPSPKPIITSIKIAQSWQSKAVRSGTYLGKENSP